LTEGARPGPERPPGDIREFYYIDYGALT
jgi:hypothetical protein